MPKHINSKPVWLRIDSLRYATQMKSIHANCGWRDISSPREEPYVEFQKVKIKVARLKFFQRTYGLNKKLSDELEDLIDRQKHLAMLVK